MGVGDHDGGDDGKKKRRGIQSNTVGNIARDELQFPTRRMGKGFVVILLEEKVEVMKVAWGLDLYSNRQAATDAAAHPTAPAQAELPMNIDEPNEAD